MWEAVEDELEVFEESEGVLALLQAGLGHVDSLLPNWIYTVK